MLLTAGAALAALPQVSVSWKGPVGSLAVVPPAGQVVNGDSPASVSLSWAGRSLALEGTASELSLLRLGDLPGSEVDGVLSVQLCNKSDGLCEQVDVALRGVVPEARRGALALDVSPHQPTATPEAPRPHAASFQTDADVVVGAAMARAAAEGKRVLLDFGAVWCPPCNMLDAEVLEAEPRADALAGVVVARVDVDDVRSYDLKSRYTVGGYPTLIVVDPDGAEISRQVGYPGRDDFLAWLGRAATQSGPDDDPGAVDPATLSPEEAGQVAWELVQLGRRDAEAFVARADEGDGEPSRAHRLARFRMSPGADDLAWLVAHHEVGDAEDWVPSAVASLADDESAMESVRAVLRAELAVADGTDAADLLYFLARASPEPTREALYGAAAAMLRTALTGDPHHDRAHLTWLAHLQASGGDVDGAVAMMEEASETWPGESTFDAAAARVLLEADRPADALAWSTRAYDKAWGDNRLGAAQLHCKVLAALERHDEAARVASDTLAAIPAPAEELQVRAHRMREALAAYQEPAAADGE